MNENIVETINENVNKNIIEINGYNAFTDYEGYILSGVNIPSLLPFNIVINDEKTSICFNTSGYVAVSDIKISDIESLCRTVKLFTEAIVESEQYLLTGARHFTESDMVFLDTENKKIKLVYGQDDGNDYGYGNLNIIIRFINSLKDNTDDTVFSAILENISMLIKERNPMLKNIPIIVEEVERKWYCRHLGQDILFGQKHREAERVIH